MPSIQEQIETPKPIVTSSRPKTTISLKDINKPKETVVEKSQQQVEVITTSKPVTNESVREAWNDFAQQRKNQFAEFQLLNREIDVQSTTIIISLTNPVEEQILQTIQSDLLTHLRNRLSNSSIKLESVLMKADSKRMAYTNKEKFDLLAEKNPMLKELKDRLGLDTDF